MMRNQCETGTGVMLFLLLSRRWCLFPAERQKRELVPIIEVKEFVHHAASALILSVSVRICSITGYKYWIITYHYLFIIIYVKLTKKQPV